MKGFNCFMKYTGIQLGACLIEASQPYLAASMSLSTLAQFGHDTYLIVDGCHALHVLHRGLGVK